jgi:alanine-synthesizing transaminase
LASPASRWRYLVEPSTSPKRETESARLSQIKLKLKKEGRRFIGMDEGDVVVFGHDNQRAAKILSQASEEGWDMYSSSTRWPEELRSAISEFEASCRGVVCTADDVIASPGIAGCYQLLHHALLDAGDEILAPTPSHYMWGPTSYLTYLGAKVVESWCDESNGWQPDLDQIRSRVTDRTKMILLNHPNNPTGVIYTEDTLRGILSIAAERNIAVVSDEIYSTIIFDGGRLYSLAQLAGDTPVILMHGLSKAFRKPGWRVGYMVIHDPAGKSRELSTVLKKLSGFYGHGSTAIPTPIMVAAARVLREQTTGGLQDSFMGVGGPDSIDFTSSQSRFVRSLQKGRDLAYKRLNEIPYLSCTKPQAALYAFPRLELIGSVWNSDEEFVLDFLESEGVLFTGGHVFGEMGTRHFRTVFTPQLDILERVFDKLEEFLKKRAKGAPSRRARRR